jgi:hypothetical protein
MKHKFMMRTRISISQLEAWQAAAFDKSMTLSGYVRFSADMVANDLARPDQLREFAAEVLHHVNLAHDAAASPEVHQHLEEASRLLLKLMRLGA